MPDTTPGMGPQDAAERQRFEHEVHRIVGAAAEAKVVLRLLGSLAFQLHCPEFGALQAKMGRAYTDIDFASYSRQAKRVSELLARLGYQENREIFVVTEGSRSIFENPSNRLHVDVFYEKLDFCHVIPWNGRLEADSPTIPLAEMFLEKMQIVQINEKDVINMDRVAGLCGSDWGLWRTVTMNLDKVGRLAQGYPQLEPNDKVRVSEQVQAAVARIEAEPKSMAWRLRSRVGDRVKWYKDVDEVH